jgi:hypothetical protein
MEASLTLFCLAAAVKSFSISQGTAISSMKIFSTKIPGGIVLRTRSLLRTAIYILALRTLSRVYSAMVYRTADVVDS